MKPWKFIRLKVLKLLKVTASSVYVLKKSVVSIYFQDFHLRQKLTYFV